MKYFLLPLTFALSFLAGCAQQNIAPKVAAHPDHPLQTMGLEELSASGNARLDITAVEKAQPEAQTSKIPMNAWQKIGRAHV